VCCCNHKAYHCQGCIGSFAFSEKFGRKKPLYLGTTLVIIGAVLQAAAYGRVQFIVGRIVGGLGTGLNTSIIPIWSVMLKFNIKEQCD
jgi:MFS family permease